MKKILILSYFFPPSNFAGSYRVASFAKYLHKYGYYPIVITRQAPDNAGSFKEMAKDCGAEIIHRKHEGYEVYYLPYKGNLRDRIYAKNGDEKFVLFRKILSFFEMLFQGLTVKAIPYANIYYFAKNYLKKHTDIDFMLCSGKPYQLFLFAHLLNKKFGIKWVADYRDEWNSKLFYNDYKFGLRKRTQYLFEKHLEKKWLESASFVTTVTHVWAAHLSDFLNKPTETVLNGFEPETINTYRCQPAKEFNNDGKLLVLHLGSLYDYQPVNIFIEGVLNLINKGYDIHCYFPGLTNLETNSARITSKVGKNLNRFIITDRLSQHEVYKLMRNADAFLMFGYQDIKGWMSSKVLEYLPWHKPIVLCPSDNALLESILKKYSKSYICNTVAEVESAIGYIHNHKKELSSYNEADEIYANGFSREIQSKNLAMCINKHTEVGHEKIKVLCFHRVSDEISPAYPPMPVRVFERLLRYLKKNHTLIGFDGVNIKTTKKKLIITFDDGYGDFYSHVYPLLKKHQVKVVLSIIAGLVESGICPWSQILNKCIEKAFHSNRLFNIPEVGIESYKIKKSNIEKFAIHAFYKLSELEAGKADAIIKKLRNEYKPELTGMVTWAQIREMEESNLVDIASHSMTHCNLTAIEKQEELLNEIISSKRIIEEKLPIKVDVFTPPGGMYNKNIEDIVFKNGYKRMLVVDNRVWVKNNPSVSRILMPYTSFFKNFLMLHLYIDKIKSIIRKFT